MFILLADQVSKALIMRHLLPYEVYAPIPEWEHLFVITHVQNTGAAFGILPGGGLFFTVLAFVVIASILYFYGQLTEESWLVRLTLGILLGGACGNLLDRLRLGYVIDFLHVRFFPPVFNVADSAIVVGVGILLLLTFIEERRAQPHPAGSAESTGPAELPDEH